MGEAIVVIDILAVLITLLAAWLWFRASRRGLRRVGRSETLDAADLNRIVVTINRSQILNRQAALATAASALIVAARICLDILSR